MKTEDNQNAKEFDEVDLLDIKKATVSLLDTVGFFVYKTGKYVIQKWMYIVIGLVVGVSFGYLKYSGYQKMLQTAEFSTNTEDIEYRILVAPQYNSIDYLDQLVETKFRDKLGYTQFKTAKLKGLDDTFGFVSQDSLHVKTLGVLASKVDSFDDLIHNYTLSKNYTYQLLTVKGMANFDMKLFITDIQKHFNEQPYFAARKQIELKKLKLEQETLEEDLKVMNTSVSQVETKVNGGLISDKMVEMLKIRQGVIARLAELERIQLRASQVLFVVDSFENNTISTESVSFEKQLVKDIVKFVLFFLFVGMLLDFVRYYRTKE